MSALTPMLAVIGCTVIANLLMKAGTNDVPSPVLLGFMSWRTAWGLAAFACGGLFYARALRFLPLNVAQSVGAVQYVAVILASRLILGEAIPLARWVGISMILTGVLVVAAYEQ